MPDLPASLSQVRPLHARTEIAVVFGLQVGIFAGVEAAAETARGGRPGYSTEKNT